MTLLDDFRAGRIDNAAFGHADHVQVGFELVARHDFDTALSNFATVLRRMAAASGVPEKFNMTITVAFLAAIAERQRASGCTDWPVFARAHPELLDRAFLRRWYTPAQLTSPLARGTFLLPRPAE